MEAAARRPLPTVRVIFGGLGLFVAGIWLGNAGTAQGWEIGVAYVGILAIGAGIVLSMVNTQRRKRSEAKASKIAHSQESKGPLASAKHPLAWQVRPSRSDLAAASLLQALFLGFVFLGGGMVPWSWKSLFSWQVWLNPFVLGFLALSAWTVVRPLVVQPIRPGRGETKGLLIALAGLGFCATIGAWTIHGGKAHEGFGWFMVLLSAPLWGAALWGSLALVAHGLWLWRHGPRTTFDAHGNPKLAKADPWAHDPELDGRDAEDLPPQP